MKPKVLFFTFAAGMAGIFLTGHHIFAESSQTPQIQQGLEVSQLGNPEVHHISAEASPSPKIKQGLQSAKLSQPACKQRGGRWAGDVQGRGRLTGCILPTTDSGKSCLDSSECEGVCLAQNNNLKDGRCNAWTNHKGCGIIVSEQGKRKVVCVD
jgi:hypothetical protein